MRAPRAVADIFSAFRNRLELGERAWRRSVLNLALLRTAAAFSLVLAVGLWLNIAIPSLGLVFGIIILLALVAAAIVLARAFARTKSSFDPRATAMRVEARDQETGRSALLATDLWALRDSQREGYSVDLINEAVAERAGSLSAVDFESLLREPLPRRWPAMAAAGFVLAIAALLVSPASMARLIGGAGTGRLAIEVEPGDVRVLAGDSLTVRARIAGGSADEPVWIEVADGDRYPMRAAGAEAGRDAREHTFPRVLRQFDYRARTAGTRSPLYHVTITERPRVNALALVIHPPAYTGDEPRHIENSDGHIAALRGSRVVVSATTSVPISRAAIVMGEGPDEPAGAMNVDGSGTAASGEFRVLKSSPYRIALTSQDGYESLPEDARAIVALDDEAPFVRFLRPEPQVTLGPSPELPLMVTAVDDYGLGPLVLHYRVSHGDNDSEAEEHELTLARPAGRGKSGRELETDYSWDLRSLSLGPGDVVSYWATIRDNDAISGPKEARTPIYQARFPGLEEVYAQVTGESEEQRKSLEDIAQEERELQKKMEDLTRETARKDDLSWEERQQLTESIEKQRELQSKVGEVIQALEESAHTAEQHDLLSQEILDRMAELQSLMKQVATPELLQAMEKLQQQMAKVSPEDLAKAMKQLSLNQDEFLKRLERTIELLKHFEMEQRLEELVQRADELLDRQDQLLDELAKAEAAKDQAAMKDLATREERVSADTEKLQDEAEKLSKELQEKEPGAAGSLDEATTSLDSEGVKEDLNEASQNMTSGNSKGAKSSGSKGRSGQKRFRDRLAMAQNQFTESLRQEVMAELRRASKEVLALSLDEETLAGRMETTPGDRSVGRELAADQQDLLGGLNQVAERLMKLSEKTLFVSPQVGRSLGMSLNRMNEAVGDLSEGRTGPAGDKAKNAIVAMNETVIELRKASDQASSCQSPTGMSQMMQTLSTLSCDQAGLNQDTQALQQQMGGEEGGGLSDEARAQMSRLAAEQRAVSETLRKALDEGGGSGNETLGRLDKTLDEMQQTMEDLSQGRLTTETTNRQERILSRLLDAQRSAKRRDFEERRTSRPGVIVGTPVSPAPLPPGLVKAPVAVREDLLRSASERYPAEYEALIREYFRSLWSEESQ